MAEFKKIGAETVPSAQRAGTKIYFEGKADAYLFKEYWFPQHNDKISFEAAKHSEELADSGGGCRAVRIRVENYNEIHRQTRAYGIVDRDSLLDNNNPNEVLFYESDDAMFLQKNFNDNIYTLSRWEIESYALSLENIKGRVKDKTFDESIASQDFSMLEESIILHTCASILSLKTGTRASLNTKDKDIASVKSRLKEIFSVSDEELDIEQGKIAEFGNNESSFEYRWERLSRLLDAKKALVQINDFFKDQLSGDKKKGFSLLGNELLSHTEPPDEISDFIESRVLSSG